MVEYNYVTKQSLLNPFTINFGHNYAKICIFLLQATTKKSQCSTFSKYRILHHACFSVRIEPLINESGHDGFANMEQNPAISFVFAANWHHCNKERAVQEQEYCLLGSRCPLQHQWINLKRCPISPTLKVERQLMGLFVRGSLRLVKSWEICSCICEKEVTSKHVRPMEFGHVILIVTQ